MRPTSRPLKRKTKSSGLPRSVARSVYLSDITRASSPASLRRAFFVVAVDVKSALRIRVLPTAIGRDLAGKFITPLAIHNDQKSRLAPDLLESVKRQHTFDNYRASIEPVRNGACQICCAPLNWMVAGVVKVQMATGIPSCHASQDSRLDFPHPSAPSTTISNGRRSGVSACSDTFKEFV